MFSSKVGSKVGSFLKAKPTEPAPEAAAPPPPSFAAAVPVEARSSVSGADVRTASDALDSAAPTELSSEDEEHHATPLPRPPPDASRAIRGDYIASKVRKCVTTLFLPLHAHEII